MSFSIKFLLAALGYVALGCAACFEERQILAELFLFVTFVAIGLALVRGMYGPANQRPALVSFALTAAAYLALTVYPGHFEGFPTTRLMNYINHHHLDYFRGERWTQVEIPGFGGGMDGGMAGPKSMGRYSPYIAEGQQNVVRIGHCVVAMLLGLIAAEVARRSIPVAARRDSGTSRGSAIDA